MKLRELLQTKLWGKITAQGLFPWILVAGLLTVFGWGEWKSYQNNRLSDGERKTARIAFRKIIELQKETPESYEKFIAVYDPERKAIEAANAAAITEKDKITVTQLKTCDSLKNGALIQTILEMPPSREVTPEQFKSALELSAFSKRIGMGNKECDELSQTLQ
ncbi:MAG: hypothetical protein WB424_11280 [Terracidiphilus sp.]